jgi:CubicO group peptidase (beta-lactamase class C family)
VVARPSGVGDDGPISDSARSNAAAEIENVLHAFAPLGLVVGFTDRQGLHDTISFGVADRATNEPLEVHHRFPIGSISKSFTAVALLQLVMEGRLELDASIARYLPSLRCRPPVAAITVHSLLTHTSGLPNYLTDVASSRYLVEKLRDFVPSYSPGSHFWYSNTGYQLLGYILENIEQSRLSAILEHRIFRPLGMTSTYAAIDHAERTKIATGYIRWPANGAYVEAPWFEYTSADGSIISSVADLCAYARFLLKRGDAPDGRLLSEASFEALTTPFLQDYAFGFSCKQNVGKVVIGHDGEIGGFFSSIEVHLDDGYALIFLSNSPIVAELRKAISEIIAQLFRGDSQTDIKTRLPLEVRDIRCYSGLYRLVADRQVSGVEELEFFCNNDELRLKRKSEIYTLERMGGNCFRIAGYHSDEYPFFFWREEGTSSPYFSEVSHGAEWYISNEFSGNVIARSCFEYSAYVGHFENNDPECPSVRVLARNGSLFSMMGLGDGVNPTPLEQIGEGLFRVGMEVYSPERLHFDTIVEGVALRILLSGMPLYRKDTP